MWQRSAIDMNPRAFTGIFTGAVLGTVAFSVIAQEDFLTELEESSDGHMREELGVNEITTPQIQKLLFDLDGFRPLPSDLVAAADRGATYPNRFQTGIHFGSLVADGFVVVINQRKGDVQEIGRDLIRQARSLGVGDNLTRRSKALIDLGDKEDWMGLREELIATQVEVENAMLALRDEEMAHLVSFGGWLRGFQLAANSTASNYTPQRADGLKRPDVMNYFIDRLETLNPRLKKTELVTLLIRDMKELRDVTDRSQSQNRPPSKVEVDEMRDLANTMVTAALSKVDDKGNLLNTAN